MSDLSPADWARLYTDHGLELVELKPASKVPPHPDWQNSITPPEHWEKSPDSNMGAKLGESGIASLDLDDLDATRTLFSDFGVDLDALIANAPTIQGKPGRLRVLFRATDSTLRTVKLAWPAAQGETAKSHTLFELRGGHGWQDVLPPSRHPDGHIYQWLPGKALGEIPLPDFPDVLTELWAGWQTWKPELLKACPWAKPRVEPRLASEPQRKESADVIGQWNNAHDIPSILLTHGYTQKGRDRYLAPGSTSKLPGVKILDSGRVYSHHGSDPLGDGFSHDAFDCFRLLEHGGDFKSAVRDAASRLGLRRSEPPPPPPAEDGEDGQVEHAPRVISLANLATLKPRPPSYLVHPFIPRRHLTLLGGHGEAGKSQLGLILAAHIACGQSWAGLEVTQGKVVVVSMEDDADVFLYRLKKIVAEYQIDPVKLAANMTIVDASEAGPLAIEANDYGNKRLRFTPFADKIRELAQGADLLVIDNASDAFAADANSAMLVREFLKRLIGWVRKNEGAVLMLNHIDKSGARKGTGGNSYIGSVAWHNTARSRLALDRPDKNVDIVKLVHEKLNVGRKHPQEISLQWTDEGVMVPVKSEVSEMVARWADTTQDEDVYLAIRAAVAAGRSIPVATMGNHTAFHQLTPFPELPASLKTAQGKKKVDAAMVRLARAGRIKVESYVANYKQRERWILATDEASQADVEATEAETACE